MDKEIAIDDQSGDRKYFTMLPNYILNHSTANDQALYMQMKKTAGEGGRCFISERKLMEKMGIGEKALKKSMAYLLNRGWIRTDGFVTAQSAGGPQKVKAYRIVDIWKYNLDHYEGASESVPLVRKTSKVLSKGAKGASESGTSKNLLIKTTDTLSEGSDEKEFNFDKEIEMMRTSKRKDYNIIALYWRKKGFVFDNREQSNASLKRELRPAQSLKGYTGLQIARSIKYCEDEYEVWTLETVGKRISDLENKRKTK